MDTERLSNIVDLVHGQLFEVAAGHEEFLVFIAVALMRRGALSADDVSMALEAQQRVIEQALDRGEDPRLQAQMLRSLADSLRAACARLQLEAPRLRPLGNPPDPVWPDFPAND